MNVEAIREAVKTEAQLGSSINPAKLREELRTELMLDLCELTSLALVLLLTTSYVVRRSLIKPLGALEQAMLKTEEVAEDEDDPRAWETLEERLPSFSSRGTFPELSHMGKVYQSMISTLIQRQREILLKDENLRITFDSIGDGSISTDAIGNIVRMNPVAEQLTGWSEQEAKGLELSQVFKIIDVETREPEGSGTRDILRRSQSETQSKQHILVSRDLQERQISDVAAPIKDGHKKMQGIVLVFRDISIEYTMREELQLERKRSINIIEGTHAGTWDWNIDTGELILNDRSAEIIGYRLEELAPITIKTWSDNVHPADLQMAKIELEKHFVGAIDYYDVEFRQAHKDGHWVWVNARGKVVESKADGSPLRMSGTHLDISTRKHAEENLTSALGLLQSVFDSAALVSIIATDTEGMITVFNSGAERMLGYSADEMVGKNSPVILHLPEEIDALSKELGVPEDMSRFDVFKRSVIHPSKGSRQWSYIKKNGDVIQVSLAITPIRDDVGHITGYLGVAMDLSERIRAEQGLSESRHMLRNVLDSIPVRVFWKDLNSTFLGCNELFAQDFGRNTTEEVIGMNDYDLSPHEFAKGYIKDDRDVIATGQAKLNFEELQRRRDGRQVWLKTSKMPLRNEDGKIVGVLGTFEDISLRKKAETDLIAAKEQAEAASRAKDDFLAIVSHEMRTPLNPILGFADLMRQSVKTDPEAGYLETIISSANRQLRLIDDILDYMRIHSGNVEPTPEPVYIVDLCETAVYDVSTLAEHVELSFFNGRHGSAVDGELAIHCDLIMLRRVLDNLLNNACKYTREGSVSLELHLESGNSGPILVIMVSDTGVGISEEMQTYLFEAFRQADSSYTRKHEGLGLGLAITRQLLNILGGTIEVESELGKGSTFTVRLPCAPIETSALPKELQREVYPTDSLRRPCTVLIADDRNDNLLIAKVLVEKFGAETVLATNGVEAIDCCTKYTFDAILMDLAMPLTNGLEAASQIRGTINPNQNTPIIAVTADVSQGVRASCDEVGIEHYLSKPLIAQSLYQTLEKCLVKPSVS